MHLRSNNQKQHHPTERSEYIRRSIWPGFCRATNPPKLPHPSSDHEPHMHHPAKKKKNRSLQDFEMQSASQICKIMATCFTTMYNIIALLNHFRIFQFSPPKNILFAKNMQKNSKCFQNKPILFQNFS